MAKILTIDSNCIANPEKEISLLIGLENAEFLLREVHYINGNMVSNPQFTKDIMPSSSWLTNELVIVGSIGGNGFGGHSNVHFADTSNANMLKNMKVMNSTFHFEHPPAHADVELIEQKHEYRYSETNKPEKVQPYSCKQMMIPNRGPKDDDELNILS